MFSYLQKVPLTFDLMKNMGSRYVLFRLWDGCTKKIGGYQLNHPTNPRLRMTISLNQWRTMNIPFVFDDRQTLSLPKYQEPTLKEKANRILNGEVQFFSFEWKQLGPNYNWITHPETQYEYNNTLHWSAINDFDKEQGDIKYVWEKSRFSHLINLMRYDYHFEEDHSEFVFQEIADWIHWNPINQGPNWKCSQEISLRVFNWMYLLLYYKNSPFLTEVLWEKIQNSIYWQLHHVYHRRHFSLIAVRNNHAITETLLLSLSEIMFPFFPETKKWAQVGRKCFEREIAYQIYEDGAYIQHSMNYHRVVIQLLSFGLSITEKAEKPFSKTVYDKAYKSLNFLLQFVQKENGYLPNYGANDGAWFFPLSESHYRDFRPQLNSLHQILTSTSLFGQNEDFFQKKKSHYSFAPLKIQMGCVEFNSSGYYLFRNEQSFTFIKCGSYKDRPSHADNLHLDIWVKGENILRDSGSYQYNTDPRDFNYFFGSQSHNTVVVADCDQMLKGNRFIWYYWTKALAVLTDEDDEKYTFEGSIKAFQQLGGLVHKRKVSIYKNKAIWIVEDYIDTPNDTTARQLWHIHPESLQLGWKVATKFPYHKTDFQSYFSSFYGVKEAQTGIAFEFKNSIKTILKKE